MLIHKRVKISQSSHKGLLFIHRKRGATTDIPTLLIQQKVLLHCGQATCWYDYCGDSLTLVYLFSSMHILRESFLRCGETKPNAFHTEECLILHELYIKNQTKLISESM